MPRNDALLALDAKLLAAHAAQDGRALIPLYCEAARAAPDALAEGFYLTQAYIFALEAGAPEAPKLKAALVDRGLDVA